MELIPKTKRLKEQRERIAKCFDWGDAIFDAIDSVLPHKDKPHTECVKLRSNTTPSNRGAEALLSQNHNEPEYKPTHL